MKERAPHNLQTMAEHDVFKWGLSPKTTIRVYFQTFLAKILHAVLVWATKYHCIFLTANGKAVKQAPGVPISSSTCLAEILEGTPH